MLAGKGNECRYLNHSHAPNVVLEKWLDAATGHYNCGLFTTEVVAPGTELTWSYQGSITEGFTCYCWKCCQLPGAYTMCTTASAGTDIFEVSTISLKYN